MVLLQRWSQYRGLEVVLMGGLTVLRVLFLPCTSSLKLSACPSGMTVYLRLTSSNGKLLKTSIENTG